MSPLFLETGANALFRSVDGHGCVGLIPYLEGDHCITCLPFQALAFVVSVSFSLMPPSAQQLALPMMV